MNQALLADFTEAEVIETLFMMKPMGTSGPNGFPVYFYQKYWVKIEKEVSHFVIDV